MVGKAWWQSNLWQSVRLIISEYAREQINAGSQLACLFFPFFSVQDGVTTLKASVLGYPLGMPSQTQPKARTLMLWCFYSSYADSQNCPLKLIPCQHDTQIPYFKSNLPLLTPNVSFFVITQSTCSLGVRRVCLSHHIWSSATTFVLSLSLLLPQISHLLSCFCLCCCFVATAFSWSCLHRWGIIYLGKAAWF